jgi:hypothetical protein
MSELFTRSDARAVGAADFDFLHGSWEVEHRRLRHRLADDSEWQTFGGSCECRPVIGGIGNIDDCLLALQDGAYRAATFRLFNADRQLWSIWWADGRRGELEPPVLGRFNDGVGRFVGDDTFEGRPIKVRFIWSDISANSARWEQAFSDDRGTNWETNWVMTFVRAA